MVSTSSFQLGWEPSVGSNPTKSNLLFWPFSCFHFLLASIRNQQSSSSGSISHQQQLTALLCASPQAFKMPTSISKGEVLSILIEKGHTSPLTDEFKTDLELILFQKFGIHNDNECDPLVKAVQEKARRFHSAVTPLYRKHRRLETILDQNKVRNFSLILLLPFVCTFL